MPKYLVNASYSSKGTRGLLQEGGTSRQKLVEEMASQLGGNVESFYYCFGVYDVIAIIDLPDASSAAALSLAVRASGAVDISLTVLLSPQDIDEASKKTIRYRPPGK